MQYPKIPNFYLANLEMHQFFEDFDGLVAPRGCIKSKSWIKKRFWEFNFRGGAFYIKYPNFDFWFSPFWDRGYPWGPRDASNEKVALNKKWPATHFSRGAFYKKYKFQNFGPLVSQPRLSAPYSPAVGRKFRSQLFFALSSCFQEGLTQPPCPYTLGGDRFGREVLFRGPGLTPRARGSKLRAQKLLARSWVDPENLTTIWPLGQKLFHIVAVTREIFVIILFYAWGDGKLQTLQNFYHFTSWSSLHSLHSWRINILQHDFVLGKKSIDSCVTLIMARN